MSYLAQNGANIATAVFTGLSAIFAFFEYKRNNPRIRVVFERGLKNLQECMKCRITNSGRRPVNIVGLKFIVNRKMPPTAVGNGGILAGENILICIEPKEFVLNESDSREIDIQFHWMIRYLVSAQADVKKLCFEDSTGKLYCLKISKTEFPEFFYTESMCKQLKNWFYSKFKI